MNFDELYFKLNNLQMELYHLESIYNNPRSRNAWPTSPKRLKTKISQVREQIVAVTEAMINYNPFENPIALPGKSIRVKQLAI